MAEKTQQPQQQIQMNINLDTTPILYTDNIFLSANEDGVVLNVGQQLPAAGQVRIVARIGMSKAHGKKLISEMGKLLAMTEGYLQTGERKKN